MPALIRLPNIARLLVMNTAHGMTSFGMTWETLRVTIASFVIRVTKQAIVTFTDIPG